MSLVNKTNRAYAIAFECKNTMKKFQAQLDAQHKQLTKVVYDRDRVLEFLESLIDNPKIKACIQAELKDGLDALEGDLK